MTEKGKKAVEDAQKVLDDLRDELLRTIGGHAISEDGNPSLGDELLRRWDERCARYLDALGLTDDAERLRKMARYRSAVTDWTEPRVTLREYVAERNTILKGILSDMKDHSTEWETRLTANAQPVPIETKATPASASPQGFISHAAEDKPLADWIRLHLKAGGVPYFLSSIPGQIRPGRSFYTEILEHLRKSDRFVVILTPTSYQRLWIAFEAGAAAITGYPFVAVCANGLRKGDVEGPLANVQLLSLDTDGDGAVSAMFKELGAPLPDDLNAFLNGCRMITPLEVGTIQVGEQRFRWQGQLEALHDGSAISIGSDVEDEIASQLRPLGMHLVYRRPAEESGQALEPGVRQVFAVAGGIRRPIRRAETVLYVAPDGASGSA